MLDYLAGAAKIRFVVTIMIEEFDTIFKCYENGGSEVGCYKIELEKKLMGHSKSVQGLVVLDSKIWSASSSGKIRVHDASDYTCVTEIDTKDTRPYCIGLLREYVFVGFAKSIKIFDKSFQEVKELPEFAISFLAVGNIMWVGSEERIKLISADSLTVEEELSLPKGYFALSLAHVPSQGVVWVGCTYGDIVVISTETHEVVKQFNTSRKNIDALAVYNGRAETAQVWAGAGDSSIYVFDCKSYEKIAQLRDANMLSVYYITSFDNLVWSCSRDSNIRIWDPEKLCRLAILEDYHSDAVSRVTFYKNDDKCYAWTSSYDKSLCVWKVDLQKK